MTVMVNLSRKNLSIKTSLCRLCKSTNSMLGFITCISNALLHTWFVNNLDFLGVRTGAINKRNNWITLIKKKQQSNHVKEGDKGSYLPQIGEVCFGLVLLRLLFDFGVSNHVVAILILLIAMLHAKSKTGIVYTGLYWFIKLQEFKEICVSMFNFKFDHGRVRLR